MKNRSQKEISEMISNKEHRADGIPTNIFKGAVENQEFQKCSKKS